MAMKLRMLRIGCTVLIGCIAAACSPEGPETSFEPFTIIVVPDTQNAVDFRRQRAEGFAIDSSEIFIEQMEYIAGRSITNGGDVAFVASVGDVWQHVTGARDPDHDARGVPVLEGVEIGFERFIHPEGTLNVEIPTAIGGYQLIAEAGIPFGVAPGNHDYDAWWAAPVSDGGERSIKVHIGGLDNFRMAFGSDSDFFSDQSWYVSAFESGESSAQVFSAGGYEFLHLAFEMQAGDDVIDWARGVIAEYPGVPTIISTHDYLNARGERLPGGSMDLALVDPGENNSAEEIWQAFIRETDQIFMVLCGHQLGQAMRVDRNDAGHEVYQILSDFQERGQAGLDAGQPRAPNGFAAGIGDGWLREMTFNLGGTNPRVMVRTYSSHYGAYSSELENYAQWYRNREQPDMTDAEFLAADEFSIALTDFRERFGLPSSPN
jgi:hypothetical protein